MDAQLINAKLHSLHTLVDDLVSKTADTELGLLADGIHHYVADIQADFGESFDIEIENDPVKVTAHLAFIADLLSRSKEVYQEATEELEQAESSGDPLARANCFMFANYSKAAFDTVEYVYQQLRETENV